MLHTKLGRLGRLVVVGLTLAFPMAADSPVDSPTEIEACVVPLTESGRTARFQGALSYALNTDSRGAVVQVVRSSDTTGKAVPVFIEVEQLEACLRRWRLNPLARYDVRFRYGTGPENWFLLINGPGVSFLKVSLPLSSGSDSTAR